MKFYHATPWESAGQIQKDGKIKASWDGGVYLCKDPADSCKFMIIRFVQRVAVIEVDLPEESVQESYDHSEEFFGCKAYIHEGDIELTGCEDVRYYDFTSIWKGEDDEE